MESDIVYGDAICFVLANNRLASTVYAVLNRYIPTYPHLTKEHELSDEEAGISFTDEAEMLLYFQNRPHRDATRYWQYAGREPNHMLVGAYFTSDGQLIFSLTVDGDGEWEEKLLAELKELLQSETGLLSYNYFPEFSDGASFKQLCQSL